MSDLIDRQATYEALTEYYHHNTDTQHMALHEALDRVPSAERHGRWIPCKERLPEPDTDVLLSDNTELLFVGLLDKYSMTWIYEDCILHDLDDIKAWMPLPEPYEVETNG